MSKEINDQIIALYNQGAKVAAVLLYKNFSGLGHRESKDYVDNLIGNEISQQTIEKSDSRILVLNNSENGKLKHKVALKKDIETQNLEINTLQESVKKYSILIDDLEEQKRAKLIEISKITNPINDAIEKQKMEHNLVNMLNDFIAHLEAKKIEIKTPYNGKIIDFFRNALIKGESPKQILDNFENKAQSAAGNQGEAMAVVCLSLIIFLGGGKLSGNWGVFFVLAILFFFSSAFIFGSYRSAKIKKLQSHGLFSDKGIIATIAEIKELIKALDDSILLGNKEIADLKSLIKKEQQNKNNFANKIKTKEGIIGNRQLSIVLEPQLQKLPVKAIGTINLVVRLNEKSAFINDLMLNKITRFVSFIEKAEDDYNVEYKNSVQAYVKSPNQVNLPSLCNKEIVLNKLYQVLNTLVLSSNTNKVLFNKLYNDLEDKSIFTTVYEKQMLGGVLNTLNALKYLQNQVEDLSGEIGSLQDEIGSLQSDCWEISSNIEDIDSKIDDMNT